MDKGFKRGLAAAATLLVLAACASTPVSKGGGGGPVSAQADRRLESQAAAFESFMRNARGIDATFAGPAAVAEGLRIGSGYEPKQLEAGMVAYAALAALQEPKFVAGVRKAAQDKSGKGLAARLTARPDLAATLPGADAGAARAAAALYRQGEALEASGKRVKKASYDVQRQAWAKVFVPDAKARLTRVKQISSAGYRPAGGDQAQLYSTLAQGGKRGGPPSPMVSRGLAVAALTVLGESGRAGALMSEPRSGMCVRVAKLNLYQCLAAAGPYYEDIYCLAQHGMLEPAGCATDSVRPIRTAQR
ncbi:MAG: hypothetical protein C0481_11385 [Phenylobacterium sp.]|uniref:hypothetical protein n=1 Tax=Phenylobacterium sp. TaxID=1871053 RepID=UPI0025E7A569|nr:hypothetical protein [Phenylobacterium sp.]MBA4012460.1 hypothetical protein [Phenylobacterium sp.]